jgi:SsrA-binding protein
MNAPEIRNRQAFYRYEVLEKVEAGLMLIGSEVKSIRAGDLNFADAYVRLSDGEAFLIGCHIGEYKNAPSFGHEPRRRRKLLLHRRELRKLEKKVDLKGLTLVPLRLFFNARGFAKVDIGICRGKKIHDKRAAAKEKDTNLEIRREIARFDR